MPPKLAKVTYVVRDYDEAIHFFTQALGFELIEDTQLSEEKRWVVVGNKAEGASHFLLAKAKNPKELDALGNQAGGRVAFFLETQDFESDYNRMGENGVRFIEAPRQEPYGKVVVFEDLYGNKWDLIEPAT